jgi:hypothetical protein
MYFARVENSSRQKDAYDKNQKKGKHKFLGLIMETALRTADDTYRYC